jgi:uncharacterized protein
MPTLLYIHGFLSSPGSAKAVATESWLQVHRPDWRYCCPFLSSYPAAAKATLDSLIHEIDDGPVYLIGSSLGGFWATHLTETYGFRSVLINPAVKPYERFRSLVGQPLANYHTNEPCILRQEDIDRLQECDPQSIKNNDLYWLLVQEGDETLDYRDALLRYRGCRQTVEAGGDHSFVGYDAWLPRLAEFFEAPAPEPAKVSGY